MHISFLQSDGRSAPLGVLLRATSRLDSLYLSIAVAAACLWLALSAF